MSTTKSKSSLPETPNKASPTTTARVTNSRLSKGPPKSDTAGTPSPVLKTRASVERSPRSVGSKPTTDHRSPKVATTPPEKPQSRLVKGTELQSQLNSVQEDLKKAKEQVAQLENEKSQAIDELKEAQKVAEAANEKLREAQVAQKRAEEDSEIEKFRAVELEQAGIEVAQKKEEEWQREIESVRNQHALDVAALLSTTQELQKVRQELSMTSDAKNQALSHADDATKIAEIHAEKVEILSTEIARLKSMLDSRHETEANENREIVVKLEAEVEFLKKELEKARSYEDKLFERESHIEQLNVDIEAARMAESYARSLAEEWKNKVDELEKELMEAKQLERSASESLDSIVKQLEGNNDLLHDAESEIAFLEEKVGLLEMTIGTQRGDLEESEHLIELAKNEGSEMAKQLESLKSEIETMKEEKHEALENEKLAASSVQRLLEEKNKLINELELSKYEEQKSKKSAESLASALHEASAEARDAKEKLLLVQADHESFEAQIEDLKLVLNAKNEKYESMIDDAKHEIYLLNTAVEQAKNELQNSKAEWEQQEMHLVNCIKKTEEDNSSLREEINRLVSLLKQTEEEASASKEDEAQLKESLKEVEAEVVYMQECLKETKTKSMKLKESLLDKENELQTVIQEQEELRAREAAFLKKVEELSKLLEEEMAKKHNDENGELTDSEKEYDLLPKVVEFSEENGDGGEGKLETEFPQEDPEPQKENPKEENSGSINETLQLDTSKVENGNGEVGTKTKEEDPVEVEYKMWESCTIEKKECSPEREPGPESFEEEAESKVDCTGETFDQMNGCDESKKSPIDQQHQKKKKPLLRKFGSLLKKKGSNNTK